MSISENRELRLSQLIDGELPAEEANQLLNEMLDELGDALFKSETCHKLHSMLQLQRAFTSWRRQTPCKQTVVVTPAQPASLGYVRFAGFAVAALLGGVLVAGGFLLGGRFDGSQRNSPIVVNNDGNALRSTQSVVTVTPEQRREIARAFALHESVAGPLSWYAADDATIQVAPSEKKQNLPQPVAVVLRLAPSSKNAEVKTFVIVCRDNDPATVKLPRALFAEDVRLQLVPKATDKGINLQYTVIADDSTFEGNGAALVGRRQLDLNQTSLGQIALDNSLVNVDASAWIMRNE
jgi:hypothetical protein